MRGVLTVTDVQNQVRDFHRLMIGDAVTPEGPARLDQYNGELRCLLIEEESGEFRQAWEHRDRMAMIDALCDLLYVTLGAGVELGIDLGPFFDEVHTANMKKVGGRVREDGKQLKPEGWRHPDIEGVFHRLYGDAPEGEPQQKELALSSAASSGGRP
jgi:predicted HAD superfamily Cof-like phosphohydrolase